VEYAPSRPLMRSLLSQSQTPTTPRRVVGFFGSGRSPAKFSLLDQLIRERLGFALAASPKSVRKALLLGSTHDRGSVLSWSYL
jgi:hypothetical protein